MAAPRWGRGGRGAKGPKGQRRAKPDLMGCSVSYGPAGASDMTEARNRKSHAPHLCSEEEITIGAVTQKRKDGTGLAARPGPHLQRKGGRVRGQGQQEGGAGQQGLPGATAQPRSHAAQREAEAPRLSRGVLSSPIGGPDRVLAHGAALPAPPKGAGGDAATPGRGCLQVSGG